MRKQSSPLVEHDGRLLVSLPLLGYENGLLIAMISGCATVSFKDEKDVFISVEDAIALNRMDLNHPSITTVERQFRTVLDSELSRVLSEFNGGSRSHRRFCDKYVVAFYKLWRDDRKGHPHRAKVLRDFRNAAPGLIESL